MALELHATEIIKRPLISEKSTWAANSRNSYTFEVDRSADKTQIKKAVEELYKVKVEDVRTVRVLGKSKRTKKGFSTPTEWKKAIVKLNEQSKIDLF